MTDSLYEQYREAALKLLRIYQYDNYSDHVLMVIISVMMTRDKVQMGGHFVNAVCNNDLAEAVGRADSEIINHLKIIVTAYKHAHIKN